MEPTCVDTIVQTVPEAHMLMYAVLRAMRPLIHRRPCNDDERAMIRPGAVFVWEEGSGIERWTDRREWGDSRSREDFLFYTEGPKASSRSSGDTLPSPTIPKEEPLVKQTYTALVDRGEGLRKWHLIAYFKESTKHELRPVSHDPELACLVVPPDTFKQARLPKSRRARDRAWSGPGAPFQSLRPSTSGGKDPSGGNGSGSGSHYVGGGERDMTLKPVDTALRPYRLSASTTVRSNWSNSSDGGRYAGDQNQNAWPGYQQQTRSPHQADDYHHAYHEPETPTRYHMPVLEKEKRSPGSHSPTLVDEHPYVLTPFHELRPLRELLVTMGLGSADGQARRSSPLDHGSTPPIALALHEVRPIREASDPVGTIHTSDERVRRRTPLDEQVLQRLFVQSVA